MKKMLGVILCLAMFAPALAFAVGTSSVSRTTIGATNSRPRIVLTIVWAADSGAVAPAALTINASTYGISGWYLYSAKTVPGSPSPTPNYDIVINDANGFDIAGGKLADRHTTAVEIVNIGTATHGYPIVNGNLSFVVSGNSVNSATGTLILTFVSE
jgi:hypothetical protein